MQVLIIEDEGIAAAHLQQSLLQIDDTITVIDQLDSVKSAINWFQNNSQPELLFLDIQLADGLSFEIFEEIEITCPIIFTTAYDQYAIQAFKVNSIDYLLKPIVKNDLVVALKKFNNQSQPSTLPIDTNTLLNLLKNETKSYKERFVIKVGEHLKSVLTRDIKLFYSHDGSTYLQSVKDQKFILDYTLDQIEDLVDPQSFFRVSRKHMVQLDSIADIITYSNSRLKLEISGFVEANIIVSRERVVTFKAWLDR